MDLTHGVRSRPSDTLLSDRARDFLAAGPADAATLVRHVCQLPAARGEAAERIASALLGGRPEFGRDGNGRWCLASAAVPVPSFDEWRATRTVREKRAPARAAPPDDALRSLSFVVVDVETTGGNPCTGHRITEFAAVVVRDGQVQEQFFETLVNPLRSIPPMVTAVTNITWPMVRDKPPFHDICQRVLRELEGHVFVAHNATFDWKFVTTEVERSCGLRLEGRRLCTVKLARRILPQLPRRSLDWVARHYGVDNHARHRAGGDALATARVLVRLLRDAEQRGVSTWADLERLLRRGSVKRRPRRSALAMPRPVDRDTTA